MKPKPSINKSARVGLQSFNETDAAVLEIKADSLCEFMQDLCCDEIDAAAVCRIALERYLHVVAMIDDDALRHMYALYNVAIRTALGDL